MPTFLPRGGHRDRYVQGCGLIDACEGGLVMEKPQCTSGKDNDGMTMALFRSSEPLKKKYTTLRVISNNHVQCSVLVGKPRRSLYSTTSASVYKVH